MLATDCYATVEQCGVRSVESEEQCEQCGGEDGLAESAMANAGLITFATQGESAGRSSGRRTDQQHKQGSGSGK